MASYHATPNLGGKRTEALPRQVQAASTLLTGIETSKYQVSGGGTGFLDCPSSEESHSHPFLRPVSTHLLLTLFLTQDEEIILDL